jgi:hypothetical protein
MNNVVLRPRPAGEGGGPEQPTRTMNPVLARLINLSVSALEADSRDKAGNLIVNQIHKLVPSERAMLVPMQGRDRVFCVSGDLEPSKDNPFAEGVNQIRGFLKDQEEPRVLTRDDLPDDRRTGLGRKILEAMGGVQVLWLPLPARRSDSERFVLWLERWGNKPWTDEEVRLLTHARVFFGHALFSRKALVESGKRKKTFKRLFWIAVLLVMFIPIPSRVTAPFQVVPERPHYVFAPFDGIVEELAVQPGDKVRAGDLIFRYDTRVLEKQLDEALRGGLAVALAELARLEGAAYADQEARARIPVQRLEVERRRAEVAFLRRQLELSEVRTNADGVVVLDDPDALIGAFLQTGQLVLRVAEPGRTKIRIMAPVADAGLVREAAPAILRLDSDPLRTLHGTVTRVGFDVRMSDERIPSVLVEVAWRDEVSVTPGQRGSARIEGPHAPIGVQIFRKPLLSLRTLLGI